MELYRKKVRSLGFGKEGFERLGVYMDDITDKKIDFITAQDTSSSNPIKTGLKDTCLIGTLTEESSAKRNVVALPTPYVKNKKIGVDDTMKIVINKKEKEVYMNIETEEERRAEMERIKKEAQQIKKNIKNADGYYAEIGGKDNKTLRFKRKPKIDTLKK